MIIVALAFHVEIRLTLSRLFLSTIDSPATRHLPFATHTIFEVNVIRVDIHFRFRPMVHHSQILIVVLIGNLATINGVYDTVSFSRILIVSVYVSLAVNMMNVCCE